MRRTKRSLLPDWNMPSDPVKAIFWFMYWLLKVLVRYFWLPIIIMVAYEAYINGSHYGLINGAVGGLVTLLVGLAVWAVVYLTLLFFNVSSFISRIITDASQTQRTYSSRRAQSLFEENEPEGPIVEGSIITDLDEERKKRRRE